jgi:DNA polymerase I-like protein with 3'-5' exonuclease and polymerase domains
MTGANTGYIASAAELRQLADKVIADGQPISLDCETGYEGEDRSYKNTSPSLHPEENILAGYNFTNAVDWARYVPLGHDDTRYNIEPVAAAQCLWDMVSTGLCVVHNADMEERNLSRFMLEHLADDPERGAVVRASKGYFPLRSDTMMEAHALADWEHIGLKYLSREIFQYNQVELLKLFEQVMGKTIPANKRYSLRFTVLDPSDPRVFDYACDDVIQTLRLHQLNYPKVEDSFIYWLEMHDWPVIWGMEDEGLAVDWDYVDEAKDRARAFQIKMQAGLASHLIERLGKLPPKFNPNSHPQIRKVLYDSKSDGGLGLRTHIMTSGKADGSDKKQATSALALKGNSFDPFVRRLQDYRGLTKLLTTYLENWRREFGWCEDGRAHCHLLPHGAATGRFSSTDFNYQNLPKKYHYECDGAEFRFNFRDCVVTPPGYYGLGFDISQGELRILAAEAQEQSMLDAFEAGEDLHILTAMRLLGLTKEEVLAGGELGGKEYTAEAGGFRPFGKMMNFALGYQLTAQGLADRLGCSIDDAVSHFNNYFIAYPSIAAWTKKTVKDSRVTGYTKSRLGRKHVVWAYKSDKPGVQQGGERTAGNAPIQGALADMMKLIMIRCDAALADAGMKDTVRMVMNIHDALEFYVRKDVPPQQVIDLLYPAIVEQTPWTRHWPVMQPEWHTWVKWGSQEELELDENHQVLGLGGAIDIGIQEDDDEGPGAQEAGSRLSPTTLAGSVVAGQAYGVCESSDHTEPDPELGADTGRHGNSATYGHSGCVIVRAPEMPEMSALNRFITMLAEFPGPNQMTLTVPEGSVQVSSGTSLSPDDGARISLLLGGATVSWDAGSVDTNRLAEGLAF